MGQSEGRVKRGETDGQSLRKGISQNHSPHRGIKVKEETKLRDRNTFLPH